MTCSGRNDGSERDFIVLKTPFVMALLFSTGELGEEVINRLTFVRDGVNYFKLV